MNDIPIIVAEFTTNHMGNLNLLLRMVENAVQAGCDFIKMQKKDVEKFYTEEKLNSAYMSPYGENYRDYRTIFEFDEMDFKRLDAKCGEFGVEWFCTVQDRTSLSFMLRFDLDLYKVASINNRNTDFLKAVADNVPLGKTIVLSVAGSTLRQVEKSLNFFPNHSLYVLHCVAEYPCWPDHLRLGNIPVLIREFSDDRIKVGYSGHEEGILPSLAAVDMGAKMIERHFCLTRHSFVHHNECSLTPTDFLNLTRLIKSGAELAPLYEPHLPDAAFGVSFGISECEKDFLEKHRYGTKFLTHRSTLK
jgi:sialic acid synthase SpsE